MEKREVFCIEGNFGVFIVMSRSFVHELLLEMELYLV